MTQHFFEQPILNSPYAEPHRHYEVGQSGPTGAIKDGRRPSESWIPIAVAKKGKQREPVQETIDFVRLQRRPARQGDQLAQGGVP